MHTAGASGLPFTESINTANSAIKGAVAKKVLKISSAKGFKKTQLISDALPLFGEKIETLGYKLRLNTRRQKIEIKGYGKDKNQWQTLGDEAKANLFFEIQGA